MAGPRSKRPLRSPEDSDGDDSESRAEVVKRVKLERLEQSRRSSSPAPPNEEEREDEDMSGDDTDSDIAHEETYEAFQREKERQRKERKNNPGLDVQDPSGTLKSITLTNFMSHANTTVDFASKLNFLVGANGSGKSAILTAIAVVFGAKATVTGRGQGVKDLIMRGRNKAGIKVVIDNRGPGAFKPDVYGSRIIIERSIHSSGASGYTFKSSEGNIIERKREALDDMLNHFRMDIDSPLTILTQDNAKTFLATADEKKLFTFFMKGTQLAPISDQYNGIKKRVVKIQEDLNSAEEEIPELQVKERALRRQMEAAKKVSELRKEEYNLQRQIAWAYVAGKEKECGSVRQDVKDSSDKLAKIDETISDKQGIRHDSERKMEIIQREMDDIVKQREPLKLELKKAKDASAAAERDAEANKHAMNDCQGDLDSAEQEVQELTRQIAAASGDEGPNAQEAALRNKKEGAEKALRNMSDKLPRAEEDVETATQALEAQGREVAVLNNRRDELANDLDKGRQRLATLEQASTNRLARYGRGIELVLRAISRAKWRHSPPLGPIGQYVHLRDDAFQYRDVLQGAMGHFLCSFAVRHDEDKVQLMRILNDCARQGYQPLDRPGHFPPILKHAGDLFDYSRGDLSNRTDTVLSKLKIDNEYVLRILIDRFHIEKLVVSPNRSDGLDEIKRLLSQGLPEVQLLSADGTSQTGRPGDLFQSSPVSAWAGVALFVKDVAGEIGALRQEVETTKAAHLDAVAKCREQAAAVHAAQAALAEKKRAQERINKGLQDVRRALDGVNEQLADLAPAHGNALLFTKQARDEAVAQMKQELRVLRDKQKEFDAAHTQALKLADEAKEKCAASEPALNNSKQTMHLLHLKCAQSKQDETHYKRSRDQTERQLNELQQKLEQVEEEVADWTRRAEEKWARIEVTQTPEELQQRRTVLMTRIRDAEKNDNINVDDLTAKYNEARANIEQRQSDIALFGGLVNTMNQMLVTRLDRWDDLRQHICARASVYFADNMYKRRYHGKLKFDHERSKLEITVETGGNEKRVHAAAPLVYKKISSLSGGEKSYTTVSLLLALWELSPTAIRCLDEWDVFMDMVNRQIAAKLLIEGAREGQSKQFLLITPQTLSGVPSNMGPDSKVIVLKDPERGQTTLV
ncbi:hypothetical protein Q8F55_004987 [Vanrija albida]|uniref:RecF/RecN/SMC N-terminal domain-containing protein n=1 Tax=Vanrija albida TaxID=181172 RepID=A0ABR3Q0U9_9TREE